MLVASSAAMGYLVSRKLSKRVAFLNQFLQFIAYIETEIRYSSSLIIEIIRGYRPCKELDFFIKEFLKRLEIDEDINKSWAETVKGTYKDYGLSKSEMETIINFVYDLGSNDTQGQVKHCRLNCDLIKEHLRIAKDEKQRKSKLYFMMYTSAGLCLTLSLV